MPTIAIYRPNKRLNILSVKMYLLKRLAIIPVYTATAERRFLMLRRLKTIEATSVQKV